jgi:hypothetical protein
VSLEWADGANERGTSLLGVSTPRLLCFTQVSGMRLSLRVKTGETEAYWDKEQSLLKAKRQV